MTTWLKDSALLLEYSQTVQCSELINTEKDRIDEDGLPVIFLVAISTGAPHAISIHHHETVNPNTSISVNENSSIGKITLRFGCRRPAFDNVLTKDEPSICEFDDSAVDPNLFDSGYTLAGSTGFCVWAGARLLLEAFTSLPSLIDHIAGTRILELGAGVGMLGTALASLGAEVLLTDLPTLVDNAIVPNLYRNATIEKKTSSTWLKSAAADSDNDVYSIGSGWATSKPLDWTKPIEGQLSLEALQGIDIVVASDCVWLASLLCHFLDTLNDLFRIGTSKCLLSFRRRECNIGSALFTTTDALISEIKVKRGWNVRPLAWRPLAQTDEDNPTDVCLIEISPKEKNDE